jgi:DMSO/TMAO reductase YedYZ molybdopterin-dependent catalytic subunit
MRLNDIAYTITNGNHTQTGCDQQEYRFSSKIKVGGEAGAMVKFKKIVAGCGLTLVTLAVWVVSACTQSGNNSPGKITSIAVPRTQNINSTTEPSAPDNPATTAQPAATPAQTEGQTTPADINSYVLNITGLVQNPLALSYTKIQALPQETQYIGIYCPGVIREADEWTGVSIKDLLSSAGLMPEASEVYLIGADGYYQVLSLQTALASDVFLAYQMNGQPLSQDRGYPLRLINGGSEGGGWVRWVTGIEVKSAVTSFSNPSGAILNRQNIPVAGSKLCACFLSAAVINYPAIPNTELKTDESDPV